MFTKASCLANQVSLSMSPEVPLVVEYNIGEIGHVRYRVNSRVFGNKLNLSIGAVE